jgi:hypothetical protein
MARPGGWMDLSESTSAYLALLADPHGWRERLVNELRFGSLNRVRSTSSYQVDFPPELVEQLVGNERPATVNLLLPLTMREKRPLLNLSVSGPGGCPATVIVRRLTAHLQTAHVFARARKSKEPDELESLLEERLCEAICVFSPGYFSSNFAPRKERDDPVPGAATFVLVREQTALAVRLQVIPRGALAVTALGLWAAVSIIVLTAGDPSTSRGESHPTPQPYFRLADKP